MAPGGASSAVLAAFEALLSQGEELRTCNSFYFVSSFLSGGGPKPSWLLAAAEGVVLHAQPSLRAGANRVLCTCLPLLWSGFQQAADRYHCTARELGTPAINCR